MGLKLFLGLLLAAVLTAPVGYAVFESRFSHEHWDHQSGGPYGGGVNGAPGPIAGAGLPFIAVGYGAFWLVRRYRRKSDKPAA